jgi:secreted trypsin-like serine protease
MSARAFRLAAILLALSASPAPATQSRIVGGVPATQAYPYQALLEIDLPGDARIRCGGTLVAARYVVTAAHCINVNGQMPEGVAVSLGQSDVTAPARNFSGAAWEPHPDFEPGTPPEGSGETGGDYDVAVLRLDRPAEFEQARLLRPADTGLWAAGVTATVIGWGMTEDEAEGGARSNQLREVAIPIYSDQACAADFQAARAPAGFFDPLTMFCAGGKDGKDACSGDSGGPLLVPDGKRLALAGVVSFGAVFQDAGGNEYSCAENVPAVYTRIAADPLNGWIRERVPQVEIDVSPAAPEPGQRVTLTAAGSNPNGAYDRYEWDLDADGAFDDADGPGAALTTPRGTTTVAVRATRGLGDLRDQEIRRADVVAMHRSAVGFPAPALTVTEGQAVQVQLNKAGSGAGSVIVTPSSGTAVLGGTDLQESAAPLRFDLTDGQASQAFELHTLDDRDVEPPETFTLDLGGYTGELVAGATTRLTVTIADDDVRPRITGLTRSGKRRRGRVKLRYRITTAATVTLGITDARGQRMLAAARRRHSRPGTYTATVRLRKAATRLLRKRRTLKARAVYAIFDGDDLLDSRILKFKLRR